MIFSNSYKKYPIYMETFFSRMGVIVPNFSNHMSYQEIADALHHAHLASKNLDSSQWQCLSESLKNPLNKRLLELYPLPKASQKVVTDTLAQIRARDVDLQHHDRNHRAADLNVHSIIYSGEREKTAHYLKKTYPPVQRADLMEKFRSRVREAIYENLLIQKELVNAEKQRWKERIRERKKFENQLLEENSRRSIDIFNSLPPVIPAVPLSMIQSDFLEYLQHLETSKNNESTYGWDILESLIQYYESRETEEQKNDALLSLILSLDASRTSYHASQKKFIAGHDYSCQGGFEERLLDDHQFLRPLEVKDSVTEVEQAILALTEPFLSHDAVQEGCRSTFSAALYQMYCKIAGYQVVKSEPIELYTLEENALKKNDTELEEEYLLSIDSLSAQMKTYHVNQFRSLLGSLRTHAVSTSAKSTPELKYLQEKQWVKIITYQPEEDMLQRVGPEKTESEIFGQMLEHYSCFLGAAHLKLVLTLHNLYGRFDGPFETYATFSTLKMVAESGIIPDSKKTIDPKSIRIAYSGYLATLDTFFYDFYPSMSFDGIDHSYSLYQRLSRDRLQQLPCSEDVLIDFLKTYRSQLSNARKVELAVSAVKTGYAQALTLLLSPPSPVSPQSLCPQERKSLLRLATEYHHTHIVRKLIASRAHVNTATYSESPLMVAAGLGDLSIAKELISAGADIQHVGPDGSTPLFKALAEKKIDIVRLLIAAGVSTSYTTDTGKTALMTAADCGHLDGVRELIAAGADLNHQSAHGDTALIWAVNRRETEIVKELISFGASVDPNQDSLVRAIAPNFSQNISQIAEMIVTHDRDGILQLLQTNPKAGNTYIPGIKSSAIMFALQKGHWSIVQDFMSGEMAPCHIKDAILYAIEHPVAHDVIPVLAQGPIVDMMIQQKYPIIAMATRYHCLSAIDIFLKSGADLSQPDQDGYTACMHAKQRGEYVLCELLKTSADPIKEYLQLENQKETGDSLNHRVIMLSSSTQHPQSQKKPHHPSSSEG